MPKISLPADVVRRLEAECRPEYDEMVSDAIHSLIIRYRRISGNNESVEVAADEPAEIPEAPAVSVPDEIPEAPAVPVSGEVSEPGAGPSDENLAPKEFDAVSGGLFDAIVRHESGLEQVKPTPTSTLPPRYAPAGKWRTHTAQRPQPQPENVRSFLPFCIAPEQQNILARCAEAVAAQRKASGHQTMPLRKFFQQDEYLPPASLLSLNSSTPEWFSVGGIVQRELVKPNGTSSGWKGLVDNAIDLAQSLLVKRGERNPDAFIRRAEDDVLILPKILNQPSGERSLAGIRKTKGSSKEKLSYAIGAVKQGWFLSQSGVIYWKSIIAHGKLRYDNSCAFDNFLLASAIIQEACMDYSMASSIRLAVKAFEKPEPDAEPVLVDKQLYIKALPADASISDPALCQITQKGLIWINLAY